MERVFRLGKAAGSLPVAIACMAWLMVLVAACTVAQVWLGNYAAVRLFIDSAFLRWRGMPVLPGGGLTGGVLLVNLISGQAFRLELSRRKAGLWLTHLGLIVLFAGQFVSAAFQKEAQLVLREGRPASYAESLHGTELYVLRAGREIPQANWPFALRVADSGTHPEQGSAPARPWEKIDVVSGTRVLAQATLESGGPAAGLAAEGGPWQVGLRPRRVRLPYSLTLEKFIHQTYPGSDIPKTFASVVSLDNPATGERREVVISMNGPLRYAGRAFYQASFDEDGAVSILQVVKNPGWTLPYAACALIGLGLLLHFATRLRGLA